MARGGCWSRVHEIGQSSPHLNNERIPTRSPTMAPAPLPPLLPLLLLSSLLFAPSLSLSLPLRLPSNPIGANVDGVDYRGRTQPFVNLVRQAQPFMSMANSSVPAAVNAQGWPLESFTVQLQTLGADLTGRYLILATTASAGVTVTSLMDGTIVSQTYDPTQQLLQATLSITNASATDIALQFAGVRSAVVDLAVLLPGFDASQRALWNPAYVGQLRRYSVLRMLPMTSVDRDFIQTWDQRATPANSPSWSTFCCPNWRNDSSVPWEAIVALGNQVGSADLWLNLPVRCRALPCHIWLRTQLILPRPSPGAGGRRVLPAAGCLAAEQPPAQHQHQPGIR